MNITDFFVKIFFISNSLSLLFVIYLIENNIYFFSYKILSYILYLLIALIGTLLCICISDSLPSDSINGGIISTELANDTFLPVYLSYFFIALSIHDFGTLFLVYFVFLLLTSFSSSIYFNPLFIILGYNIYKINKKNGTIYIICKKKKNFYNYFEFLNLKRINDYTFFERS